MSTKWADQNRTLADRVRAEFESRTLPLRFPRRIDIILCILLLLCVIVLWGGWTGFVKISDRLGLFDPELIQFIEDERILTNVRDNIKEKPLLDAVIHQPDGLVYLSQAEGVMHRYDPLTHLWSFEPVDIFENEQINKNLTFLRSGCGADPLSSAAADCPEPDSLWGISAEGGLVRRSDGEWKILVSDTAFIGANGKPVEGDELSTAAVSGDKKWLVLGTKNNGAGIYNTENRLWIRNDKSFFNNLPCLSITHIAWWKNRFWIGGPKGLISLEIDDNIPHLVNTPGFHGKILDLDVSQDAGQDAGQNAGQNKDLWVLAQRDCLKSGSGCLWMGRLETPDEKPVVLMDEQNIYPNLNLSDLNFAQYHNNQLYLAGESGLFSYDAMLHTWKRLFNGNITATLPFPGNSGFFFGFTNGLGICSNNSATTWPVPGEKFIKLLYSSKTEALALSASGNVYSFTKSGKPSPVFKVSGTQLDHTRFSSAFSIGDTVVFTGPDGGLLHNISTREYKDVPGHSLPQWLRNPGIQLIKSGRHIYALSPSGRNVAVHTLDADKILKTDFRSVVKPYIFPGPLKTVRHMGNQGLRLIARDGRVYHVTPQGQKALTGPAAPEMSRLDFIDVTAINQDLLVSTMRGIRRYDTEERKWTDFSTVPADSRALEIDTFNGQIIMRTDQDRLVRYSDKRPVMIGDKTGFHITDKGLCDVMADNRQLYLAGDGWIEQYDPDSRQIAKRWRLRSHYPIKLKGVSHQMPLALSRNTATLGETIIDPNAGQVTNLSKDNYHIWTVRDTGVHKYLKGYPITSWNNPGKGVCFFRNPGPGSAVTRILDARELTKTPKLPGGIIAVATNAGLFFYNPKARSWYASSPELMPEGGRIYIFGKHMVLSESLQNRYQISFVPTDSIVMPHTCSTDPVCFKTQDITARAIAVNEQSEMAAWIGEDGSIMKWNNGKISEILPSPGKGPEQKNMQRVYGRSPEYLLITTRQGIWRYSLNKHQWIPVKINLSTEDSIADINIEQYGSKELVVIHDTGGNIYTGSFEPSDTQVDMTRIYTPSKTFNASGKQLLDVQDRGNFVWTFVLDDRIKYYDPSKRKWLDDAIFPVSDRSAVYKQGSRRGVLVTNNGQVWWVAQSRRSTPGEFARYKLETGEKTALDEDGAIWRLKPDGVLLKCRAPGKGDYKNFEKQSPFPFMLNKDSVKQALKWERLILFETDGGLRAYDTSGGNKIKLPQEAANFSNIKQARRFNRQLWLKSPDRLMILEKNEQGVIKEIIFQGISELVFDKIQHPWARFDDGWQVWDDNKFISPGNEKVKLFVVEGERVTGADEEGYPFVWQGRLVKEDISLPHKIDSDDVNSLLCGNNGDWWVLAQNRLHHVVRDTCQVSLSQDSDGDNGKSEAEKEKTEQAVETIPCFVIADSFDTPPGFGTSYSSRIINADVRTDDTLTLTSADRVATEVVKKFFGGFDVKISRNITPHRQMSVKDQWPVLKKNMKNGVYDPVTDLVTGTDYQLYAKTKVNRFKLPSKGVIQLELPSTLDAGWLRWDRSGKRFMVKTTSGRKAYAIEKFIIHKKLLFEETDTVLQTGDRQMFAANQYGIWMHNQPNLKLDNKSIVFQPLTLARPIHAAHGRFMTSGGDCFVNENRLRKTGQLHEVRFGDVNIKEQMWKRGITSQVGIGGQKVNAYVNRGFIWDRNRRHIALKGNNIFIQSEAGIHPVHGYSDFDPGPENIARFNGRLHNESKNTLFFELNNSWYKRDFRHWEKYHENPAINRVLADNSQWRWVLQNGKINIKLHGSTHNFGYGQGSFGFSFNSDQLADATADDENLYVMTPAFFEILNQQAGADSP
ncbi:MAG: hypothetical protein GY749_38575, partial [Desulfobacteraceae bacterium]|nr:hypothetical protein [Desulfobacteraceae bacterium]